MTSPYDTYTSPLASRNASKEMLRIWSARHKFQTWRRVWLAVAEAMHEVTKDRGSADSQRARSASEGKEAKTLAGASGSSGAGESESSGPLVTAEQVAELRAVVERGITDEEIERASELERELRHDVMAHVHCLGEQCPKAKPIIHLGCTSQDVVCNADLLNQREALRLIDRKCDRVIVALGDTASEFQGVPTLGFTHYQPAQPLTVGRRCASWACDVRGAARRCANAAFEDGLRGFRGATGTQASFLRLFDGDHRRVDEFEARALLALLDPEDDYASWMVVRDVTRFDELREKMIETSTRRVDYYKSIGDSSKAQKVQDVFDENLQRSLSEMIDGGIDSVLDLRSPALTTQTYPRFLDAEMLADLAAIASVLHKIATDIRLLSNRKEIDEPFGDKQIGSSAMPYKRNPMRCERICGLTRFVMNLVGNAYDTAATQWLERTLDDSSNRRLSLPEAFLALDGALDLMHNVASGLVVHEKMVERNLMAELPFLATENILMAAVKAGGDRQDLHEKIRVHSQAAGHRVKDEGLDNDLLNRLQSDPAFKSKANGGELEHELDWTDLMDPMKYIGRSVEQTERFIQEVVEPLREQYKDELESLGESEPRV